MRKGIGETEGETEKFGVRSRESSELGQCGAVSHCLQLRTAFNSELFCFPDSPFHRFVFKKEGHLERKVQFYSDGTPCVGIPSRETDKRLVQGTYAGAVETNDHTDCGSATLSQKGNSHSEER